MLTNILKENTTLQDGKYRIIRVLGQGGFGITYLAEQTMLNKLFAIKEFFIRDLCSRKDSVTVYTITQSDMVNRYRQKFVKEARIIARFNHSGIVKVSDLFKENGTFYYVMEYVKGESLSDMVKREKRLPELTALNYFYKVANALTYIHRSYVNHLDVKPSNIMIRQEDNEPILIDFGVSKQYDEQKDQTTTTPPGVSYGYSPLEQYKSGGVSVFSPQADIYALGATLFKLLTGNTPPIASDLLNDGLPQMPGISINVRKAIEKAMQPRIGDRPTNIESFVAMIKEKGTIIPDKNETILTDIPYKDEETLVIGEHYTSNKQRGESEKNEEEIKKDDFKNGEKVVEKKVVDIIEEVANKPKTINNPIINNLLSHMVKIEGGTFTMGVTSNQGSAYSDEKPIHKVTVSTFYLNQYEVTQEEWETVMGKNPSSFIGPKRPVEHISWDDCRAFIRKLNALTGKKFRLPTEAEWEYAARGGKKSKGFKFAGSNEIEDVAWFNANSGNETHNVGSKKPNELELYDMTGNVWEWCNDWYGLYSSSSTTNPLGPISGNERVSRGGSFRTLIRLNRISYRFSFSPGMRSDNIGLRLAI